MEIRRRGSMIPWRGIWRRQPITRLGGGVLASGLPMKRIALPAIPQAGLHLFARSQTTSRERSVGAGARNFPSTRD